MFPVLSTQKRTLRTTPGRNGQRRFSKSASLLTQLLGSTRIDFNRNPSQADVPPFLGLPVRNLFVHSYTCAQLYLCICFDDLYHVDVHRHCAIAELSCAQTCCGQTFKRFTNCSGTFQSAFRQPLDQWWPNNSFAFRPPLDQIQHHECRDNGLFARDLASKIPAKTRTKQFGWLRLKRSCSCGGQPFRLRNTNGLQKLFK